jgi:hypothetical protein
MINHSFGRGNGHSGAPSRAGAEGTQAPERSPTPATTAPCTGHSTNQKMEIVPRSPDSSKPSIQNSTHRSKEKRRRYNWKKKVAQPDSHWFYEEGMMISEVALTRDSSGPLTIALASQDMESFKNGAENSAGYAFPTQSPNSLAESHPKTPKTAISVI